MLTAKVYAKVNLFLDVTGKDPNGYHTVDNVMQSVTLCDTVSVAPCSCGGIQVESSSSLLGGENDIVYIAAKSYAQAANLDLNLKIKVKKEIPIKAGLGGGSADAAAVLCCLEKMFSALGEQKLLDIAAKIGADVPFFISGGTAVCSHYGEIITPTYSCPDCFFVIAKAGEKPSTAQMYKKIDELNLKTNKKDIKDLLSSLKGGDLTAVCDNMMNIFEYVWDDDKTAGVFSVIKSSGALTVHLSGSGPCVFGVFDRKDFADICLDKLKRLNIDCWLCESQKNL